MRFHFETLARVARLTLVAALAAGALTLASSAPAAASTPPAPGWQLDSLALPSNFSVADTAFCQASISLNNVGRNCDSYQVTATNVGAATTDGSDIVLSDTLPAGVTVQAISLYSSATGGQGATDLGAFFCDTATVTCTWPGFAAIQPGGWVEMVPRVTVDTGTPAGAVDNQASVSGGGAAAKTATATNTIGEAPPQFGVEAFTNQLVGPDGTPDTQAGDHPYQLTTRIDLNTEFRVSPEGAFSQFGPTSVEDVKDIVVDLPLGVLGNAQATPTCTLGQMSGSDCPADSQIGSITIEPNNTPGSALHAELYNLAAERGVAGEFGFVDETGGSHVLYAHVVPTPSGYVLRTISPDIPQFSISDLSLSFFGNPAQADQSSNTPIAFLTNPSSCSGQPLVSRIYVDSWQHPASYNADGTPNLSDSKWAEASSQSQPVTGCNQLRFQSSLSVQPDTTVADSPSGLNVDIKVPQSEDPNALATPPLKDASVTLPPGFTVNPGSADGLGACTSDEIALASAASPTCPDSSKIGSVQLTTPLLPGTLPGSIYLAKQFDNPFHSLIAAYIVVDDPTTGVVIKIPGNLTPDPLTGQITGVFDNNPQFPFSELKLDFKGGATGVLATPEKCGNYTTNSLFLPWSAPDSGPAASPSDSFGITSGCVSGFKPSFTAGSQNPQAGAYSPFVLSMSRSDQQENFQGLSVTLPPGMLANLSQVQECSAADLAKISNQPGTGQDQINNPSCPATSLVGAVTTGAGTGPDPYFLNGKVYLTGPYKGASYGLAVVVPAVAGPLDLGTVVVRQALDVNPTTAQVTDVSDPFPTILDGILLRIRRVDVTLNRPQFTINPTSCDVMAVTGTATSTQGTSAPLSNRFQVGGCASLGFSPKLSMKLTGKGRTRSGAHPNLVSVLTQRGGQANIHNVRVALPLSLALDPNNSQHVCPYATAQAVTTGPANCPASTLVGHATATTPLLSQPLSGPVYLVQGIRMQNGVQIHTLPSLLIPLRGQIALDLRAQTAVSHGKLVTTFPIIPDAAVSKFTLTINGGRKGILVITGRGRSICTAPQVTQATLAGHNGKAIYPSIKMGTPCRATHRKKTRRHKKHH